ncbi:MAG: class I SAM-dependent methyltransferase [Woeseiaceae bacterium]|nr:class I SAM-dependent methyltransferase [Woeseiaceae bacterium]
MNRSDAFWDRIAEKYARRPVADEAVYRKKLEVTRQYLTPESEVLEIGCGTGTSALHHAEVVKHIRAIDFSQNMIDIARRKAKEANVGNVTFEVCRIHELEVEDESLDAVLALNILHLVDDRQPVIDDIFRMLKPGGVLVSSTACLGDKLKFFKYIAPIGRFLGLMPLVRIFTADALRVSMVTAGFTIDHDYQPEKSHAVFLVAKKPG